MANRRQDHEVFDSLPHRKIAKLYADGYDMEAICERFYWASLETLYDSVVYGRGMQRREAGLPPLRPTTRKTSIATEEAVMAIAVAKGTINGAGKAHKVSNDLVRTLFFERGLDYPRKDDGQRGASVQQTYEVQRLAKGFPPITAEALASDLAGGALPAAVARKYGMGEDTLRRRANELGVIVGVPRLDRAEALRAYESGESVRSIAERTGKTLAYVRRTLAKLGAFNPDQPSLSGLPKPKVRGRLSTATLREDLDAGLSVREIAERRGVSTSVVRALMYQRGWKANRKYVLPSTAMLRADVRKGLTVREIAERYNVPAQNVRGRLSYAKIKCNRQVRLDRRTPPPAILAARRADGARVKDLAAEYGVSPACICQHLKRARASA